MSFPIKLFAVQKDCLLVGDSSSSGGWSTSSSGGC